jgi:hypothetical protein
MCIYSALSVESVFFYFFSKAEKCALGSRFIVETMYDAKWCARLLQHSMLATWYLRLFSHNR